jgi:hypothetical protein
MQDPEIADLGEHAPGLLGSMISKLEALYMSLAENSDPAAKKIPGVVKKAREMRDVLLGGVAPAAGTGSQLMKLDAFNTNRGHGGYGTQSGALAGGYGGHAGASAYRPW